MADFRDGARAAIQNLYFFNFPDPTTSGGEGDFALSGQTGDKATYANGFLTFSKLEATLATGVNVDKAFLNTTDKYVSLVTLKENTVGADKSVFASWTWADAAGQLADFK